MNGEFNMPACRYRNNKFTSVYLEDTGIKLIGLDREIALLSSNIELFLNDQKALNTLLWGEKGAGKSTVVRIILNKYCTDGLRIVEFCDDDYHNIYEVYHAIRKSFQYKFLIYFDDVSFDESDERYRNFKSIVEGGLEEKPVNSLFLATSNRRHLIAEKPADTVDVYSRDLNNEQSSLHARFGLTIGFYPLGQTQYLEIVEYYFKSVGYSLPDNWQTKAESYAIDRGGRSGRVAQQFVTYTKILGAADVSVDR
jgi:predicted AAA+ superfamily ATPase